MAEKPPPKLTLAELAAQYGYAAQFFMSDPELKSLITKAVAQQWTADRFRAAFMATKWYRTKSAGTRSWLELESRDPVEAAQRLSNQGIMIRNMANRMGVGFGTARLRQIARDSLMFGWTDEALQRIIAAEWHYKPGGDTTGQAATLENMIRGSANDYGVTISDSQVGKLLQGALNGTYTEDSLQDYVRDMARSKYPGLAKYLEQGFTTRQVAEPYIQSYSNILEQNAETVQLNDPTIQKALQGLAPNKPNQTDAQAMTLYEFERGLRKDPRWRKTKNARESMTNAALSVLQDWGIYA